MGGLRQGGLDGSSALLRHGSHARKHADAIKRGIDLLFRRARLTAASTARTHDTHCV